MLTNKPEEADEGTVKFRSVPRAQLVPLGSFLPNAIWHQEQVSREFLEGIIFLGILGKSEIVWELK